MKKISAGVDVRASCKANIFKPLSSFFLLRAFIIHFFYLTLQIAITEMIVFFFLKSFFSPYIGNKAYILTGGDEC